MIRAQQAPTRPDPLRAFQPAMTAFASDILAALTGPGGKPGAGSSGASGGSGGAGAFEALLAGLVAQQGEGDGAAAGAAGRSGAPVASAPVDGSVASKGRVGAAPAPSTPASPEQETRTSDALPDAAVALAGAEALAPVVAVPVQQTVAAPDMQAAPLASPAVGAARSRVAEADAPAPAVAARPAVAGPSAEAPSATMFRPGGSALCQPKGAPEGTSPGAAQPATDLAASADESAPAPVRPATSPDAPAAPRTTPASGAPVSTPELVSLTARIAQPKAAAGSPQAAPAHDAEHASPDAPAEAAVDAMGQDVVEALDAVAPETAPADAAAVSEAAEFAAPPPTQPARRQAKAEPAVRGEPTTIAARAGTTTDARPAPAAAPAPKAEAAAIASPVEPAPAPVDEAPAPASRTADAPPQQPAGAAPAHVEPAAVHAAAVRGAPETVAKLASDIVRKLEGRTTTFDVQLDPLGLGKVDVSIEINADGRLTASLSFETAQAAEALRGRAGELRQALEKAGFSLTDSSLSFDMNHQGGGAERQQAGERFAGWSSRAFQTVQSGLDQADARLAAAAYARSPNGGVDIRI